MLRLLLTLEVTNPQSFITIVIISIAVITSFIIVINTSLIIVIIIIIIIMVVITSFIIVTLISILPFHVSLLQKISPITTLSYLNFRLKSVFQTFNSEATFAFVEFLVFCQILIHFCQSAKADQADLPFIGKLRPEADPENPKS